MNPGKVFVDRVAKASIAAFLISAKCLAAQTDPTTALASSPIEANEPASDTLRLTPFSSMTPRFTDSAKEGLSNAYTRLLVTSSALNTGSELTYDRRLWITRFFAGRHSSTNLSVKVTVGSFTTTVPVATIDHISTAKDGEGFTRIVYHRSEDFPLFLVKRDGGNHIVSLRSSVRVSDQLQSGAAGTALSVTQGAIRLVAPQAAVLTTLSTQSAENKATALDAAINKLFSTSIDEEQAEECDILFWGDGVQVKFLVPIPETQVKSPRAIGTWTIAFESPRPSIFSDMSICEGSNQITNKRHCALTFDDAAKAVEGEIDSAEVLSYQLIQGSNQLGTVEAYGKKQDWYTTGVKALAGTDASKLSEAAMAFCTAVRKAVAGLELNSVDQGIIAHSLALSVAGTDASKKAVNAEATCKCQYDKCKP